MEIESRHNTKSRR